jgi:hypothetical protein
MVRSQPTKRGTPYSANGAGSGFVVSRMMLKAIKVHGSVPGLPHWCTRLDGSSDMKSRSAVRISGARLRAIASDAAVPSTTEMIVVQKATTRLFQAARCIWSASIKAAYQRSERPAGGKRSDSEAVNDVIRTISVGATRKTSATAEIKSEHGLERNRVPLRLARRGHASRSGVRPR